MRGGRNKFGPMYKRDRARKLQVMRERQLTTPRGGNGGNGNPSPNNSNSGAGQSSGMYTDMGYSPSGSSVYGGGGSSGGGVKLEIQIAQVSSLTSSPDSSPSPLAASLGYPGQHYSFFYFIFRLIWQFCFPLVIPTPISCRSGHADPALGVRLLCASSREIDPNAI